MQCWATKASTKMLTTNLTYSRHSHYPSSSTPVPGVLLPVTLLDHQVAAMAAAPLWGTCFPSPIHQPGRRAAPYACSLQLFPQPVPSPYTRFTQHFP
jgi:hypothetical protein